MYIMPVKRNHSDLKKNVNSLLFSPGLHLLDLKLNKNCSITNNITALKRVFYLNVF